MAAEVAPPIETDPPVATSTPDATEGTGEEPVTAPVDVPPTPVEPSTQAIERDFYNPEAIPTAAPLIAMPELDAEAYTAVAAELPQELLDSLETDADVTGAEWIAMADASAAAKSVLDGLAGAGVTILDARMEGTELVVSVGTEAEAAVVVGVNAIAELGAGERFSLAESGLSATPVADVYGGEGYYWNKAGGSGGARCSIAFNGFNSTTSASQFLTAGHCWTGWVSGDSAASKITQNQPWYTGTGTLSWSNAGTLGARVSSSFGSYLDYAIVGGSGFTARSEVVVWGGGNGNAGPLTGTPRTIVGTAAALEGSLVCRSGSSSGWKCGYVVATDQGADVGGTFVNSSIAQVCAIEGDSGGSVVMGSWAVGITSWRTGSGDYCNSGEYMGFFPTISPGNWEDVQDEAPNWEAKVSVSTPTATGTAGTSSGSVARTTTASGTIGNAAFESGARLFVNGSASGSIVSAPSGSFTLELPSSVPAGIHTYQIEGRYGAQSTSALSGTRYFTDELAVERYQGSDRFMTAVEISKKLYPSVTTPVPVVWIANGLNYPDALAAGPAAAKQDGVLLLTPPDTLPAGVADEITRLKSPTVVIVGNAITPAVAAQLDALTHVTSVVRVAGADRFATSRSIAEYAFPSASTAFIATGLNFPDALSAASVGANKGWPVILVNGGASTAGTETIDILGDLGVTNVKVVGSEASVTAGVLSSLTPIDSSPQRIAGADRFKTSVLIAADAYPSGTKTRVYLTTGFNFPDALSGSVIAGKQGYPLLAVNTNCAFAEALSYSDARGVTGVRILGSTASVGTPVEWFNQCS